MKKNTEPKNKAEIPALDVDPILTIHPDPNGYIGFGRKPDPENPSLDKNGKPKDFEHLFSIRADELRSMFPAVVEWLTHDSYYTVNAYYRPAPWKNTTTGMDDVWRAEKHLSRLNACYSDIDCGRPESDEPGADLDWRQAQYEAGVLADSGVIPQPSIMARSGRGIYLLWLLKDEKDPTKPPPAFPEKIQLYKACNRKLNEHLRAHSLPADGVHDAARVLRVPGSIHRKAGRRVEYIVQLDQYGKGFVYTLREIASFLNIPTAISELPTATRALAKPPQYRRTKNPGTAPLRSKGNQVLNALRALDLITIQSWRGGFKRRGEKYPDGSTSPGRRRILAMYAGFLHGAKEPQEETIKALKTMAANMKPPYPSDPPDEDPPLETIVQAVYKDKPRKWYNETLCKFLGVTDDVARSLNLQTIRPPAVSIEADKARPLWEDYIKLRREYAEWFLTKKRGRVTCRELAEAYNEKGFVGANRETANQDLNAIGYQMHRSTGGRPRKTYKGGK